MSTGAGVMSYLRQRSAGKPTAYQVSVSGVSLGTFWGNSDDRRQRQKTSPGRGKMSRSDKKGNTGRSCWGRGLQDTSAAQGTKQMQGAATRVPTCCVRGEITDILALPRTDSKA